MKAKKLQDLIRNAEIIKDVNYAAEALEDYFRESYPDIDLWWFRQEIEALAEVREELQQLRVIQDIAGVSSIEELEACIVNGLKYKEQRDEELDTLIEIKQELTAVYTKLIKSLA